MRLFNNEVMSLANDDCKIFKLFKILARRIWCLLNKFRKNDDFASEIVYLVNARLNIDDLPTIPMKREIPFTSHYPRTLMEW